MTNSNRSTVLFGLVSFLRLRRLQAPSVEYISTEVKSFMARQKKRDPYKEYEEKKIWITSLDAAQKENSRKPIRDYKLIEANYWQALSEMNPENSLDAEFVDVVLELCAFYFDTNRYLSAIALIRALARFSMLCGYDECLSDGIYPRLIELCLIFGLLAEANELAKHALDELEVLYIERQIGVNRIDNFDDKQKEQQRRQIHAWYEELRARINGLLEGSTSISHAEHCTAEFQKILAPLEERLLNYAEVHSRKPPSMSLMYMQDLLCQMNYYREEILDDDLSA